MPRITGGLEGESTRVFGTGVSHGGMSDCIKICTVGDDGVPNDCMPDDVVLGMGTTNGGAFVDITGDGMAGIMLDRPLMLLERIYAFDMCVEPPLTGPIVVVGGSIAPAPAMSPSMILLAIGLLGAIGIYAVGRLRKTF